MRRDRFLYIILGIIAVAVIFLIMNDGAGETLGLDNSRFASLVYGGAFATVVGAGILARGGFGGGGLGQIAIWLALFVGLMIGYKLYHGEPTFPSDEPPAAPLRDSGTGISASLMDRVNSRFHLGGPNDIG